MATIVPIVDTDRGFRIWKVDELFVGQGGSDEARYVPNKDDLVVSYTDGFLRVASVDYSTGLSTLVKHKFLEETGIADEDTLLGAGPSTTSESYRVYIDTSVKPHTLAFDARLKVYGTTVRSVKVLRGAIIEGAEVISRAYDAQGGLLGEAIALEDVQSASGVSRAIRTPKVGHSSLALPDGEVVTALFYDDVGAVVSTARLLVKNTGWMRSVNESVKYVTAIELDSPFLSDADNRVLECPINVPINSITRRGIVHYSNGQKKILPIDGTKFNLFGLQRFISTILGQKQPMTLINYLSPDEVAYGSVPGGTRHMTQEYLATTTKVEGAYSVKLFSYPVWVDEVTGYRLEHFLYNLERDQVFNVTSKVVLAANSRIFDPLGYGLAQDLVFSIDLSSVDPSYKNYRHLQNTRISLLNPGLEHAPTNWLVSYDKTKPPYGEGIHAEIEFINSNLWYIRLDNGMGSVEEWLREVYEKTRPLFDQTSEATPVTPNFFRMVIGSTVAEYSISQWDHEFTFNRLIRAGDNVYIQFFRRTSTTDLELATAAMILRQVN